MKSLALTALILAVVAMFISLSMYATTQLGVHNMMLQRIIWPISIVVHGLPTILLAIALITQKTSS